MDLKRGDIFLANLGDRNGNCFSGIRPVIVLQNNIANEYLHSVIVAPLTSKREKYQIPTHITVDAKNYGLNVDSTIMLERIITIDKDKLIEKISSVDNNFMIRIVDALNFAVDSLNTKIDDINVSKNTIQNEDNNSAKFKELNLVEIEDNYNDYRLFYEMIKENTDTVKKLEGKFGGANSLKNKLKEWVITGIIGVVFGFILSLLL